MSKPSRESIRSEPAGPQMDAWVAEHCLSWAWLYSFHLKAAFFYGPEVLARKGALNPAMYRPVQEGDELTDMDCPPYSTDISQAIGAAEEMRKAGKINRFALFSRDNLDPATAVVRVGGPVTARGDTLAHALARTLLLAVIQ